MEFEEAGRVTQIFIVHAVTMVRHVETVAASTIKLQFTCEFFGPGSTNNSILLSMQMAWIGRPLMFICIMKLNLLIILILSVVNFFRWYRNRTCFRSQINFHAQASRNFTYSTHKNRSKLSNNFLKFWPNYDTMISRLFSWFDYSAEPRLI